MFKLLQISAPTVPTALPDSVAPAAKVDWALLRSLPVDDLINQLVTRLVHFAIQIAIAVVVFYAGRFIIRKLEGFMRNILQRRHVDASLGTFLTSMVRIVLYFILIVTVIGILGINTSSFIALFASAGVAIGMALSGTLQNFAGGVLILLLKPYKVGDYIEAQGYAGTVTEIQIFCTVINTYDNKSILIPNGSLSTGSINNWSREDYRRVEWSVGISYGDSFDVAEKAILDILRSDDDIVRQYIEDDRRERRLRALGKDTDDEDEESEETCESADGDCEPRKKSWLRRLLSRHHERIARTIEERRVKSAVPVVKTDRSPVVVLDQLGDSSVNLKVRAWTQSSLYWKVYYEINRRIYAELPLSGVSFPFPQLDVHLNPSDAAQPATKDSPADASDVR